MLRVISIDVGIRNLSIGRISLDLNPKSWKSLHIEKWMNIDILKESNLNCSNANHVSTCTLLSALYISLDKFACDIIGNNRIDAVLIEKQPFSRGSIGRLSMQAVMGGLFTWFLAYFKTHDMSVLNTYPLLTLLDPSCKLQVCLDETDIVLPQKHQKKKNKEEKKIKTTYRQRKLTAIQYTRTILKLVNHSDLEFFQKSKKKDDLSDTLLQALYMLQRCC